MNTADVLINLLERDNNEFIFGHPGEQILPFYKSLKDSSIKHILTRHEQGAAHAADAFARSSGNYGICISTAGPGAMNLVMGVSTAFKDSVPMLVLTGDNDYTTKNSDIFQSFPINSIFENITVKSYHPSNGKLAIYNLIEALIILHKCPKGPIHINLSKDVLTEEIVLDAIDLNNIKFDCTDFNYENIDLNKYFSIKEDDSLENLFNQFIFYKNSLLCISDFSEGCNFGMSGLVEKCNSDFSEGCNFGMSGLVEKCNSDFSDLCAEDSKDDGDLCNSDFSDSQICDFSQKLLSDVGNDIKIVIDKLLHAEKPLIIAGNGIVWSKSIELLDIFSSKLMCPVVTTYHSKGVISEYDKLNLGIVGLRGNSLSNYAYDNADFILVLGAKLSERTIASSDFDIAQKNIVHINIDNNVLKGAYNISLDVNIFLKLILKCICANEDSFNSYEDWVDMIYSNYKPLIVDGIDELEENFKPLRSPYAINQIVKSFKGSYFLSDAGTHTTWTTILSKNDKFGKLLFSGGFGPMGYGLPGAIGVAFALKKNLNEKIVVICGDGDIQMVIQELATIREYNLDIAIFIINNSQLGIIRQWEETVYDFDKYEVDLKNPNFKELANAYGIEGIDVKSKEDLDLAIEKALSLNGPFLADVRVVEENIPLPN